MRISDWSSDVCSSDLRREPGAQRRQQWLDQRLVLDVAVAAPLHSVVHEAERPAVDVAHEAARGTAPAVVVVDQPPAMGAVDDIEIGRASCRARVCQYV